MEDNSIVTNAVRTVVQSLMDRIMNRVLVTDPFVVEDHHARKPLYAALVPDEIFKGSHFERRFVTKFGDAWEQLAVSVGNAYHGKCLRNYDVRGTIGKKSLQRIQEVINRLEHHEPGKPKINPDWDRELAYVKAGGGKPIPIIVTCDVYIESSLTGCKYALELKAPMPNSDQTKVSKEKMLKLLAMNEHPVDCAYYALVYNPYGEKVNYAWPFVKRWFDVLNDSSLLIGDEVWNLIGGEGTYQKFIEEINKIGVQYRERIYREYLCIEPPKDFENIKLL